MLKISKLERVDVTRLKLFKKVYITLLENKESFS